MENQLWQYRYESNLPDVHQRGARPDLNTATREELLRATGVDEHAVEAILRDRPFDNWTEVARLIPDDESTARDLRQHLSLNKPRDA